MKKFLILFLTILAATTQAAVQDFPTKSLRMVIPLAPGGGSDIVGRILASGLTEHWKQTIVIDNRPGAAGAIGNGIVARSAPDAHTQLFTSSTLAISGALMPTGGQEVLAAFAPVSMVANQPSAILVHPALAITSLTELITQLKAYPGKFNFGSAGTGTASHLANELFLAKTRTQATHVPYKSAGVAAAGLLKSELHFMVTNFATALPLIQNNRARVVAVTSKTRHAALPEVPTVAESGVENFEYTTWYGLLVPAKTHSMLVERLNQTVVKVVSESTIRNRLEQQGLTVMGSSSRDFQKQLIMEIQIWKQVVKSAGIKPL